MIISCIWSFTARERWPWDFARLNSRSSNSGTPACCFIAHLFWALEQSKISARSKHAASRGRQGTRARQLSREWRHRCQNTFRLPLHTAFWLNTLLSPLPATNAQPCSTFQSTNGSGYHTLIHLKSSQLAQAQTYRGGSLRGCIPLTLIRSSPTLWRAARKMEADVTEGWSRLKPLPRALTRPGSPVVPAAAKPPCC